MFKKFQIQKHFWSKKSNLWKTFGLKKFCVRKSVGAENFAKLFWSRKNWDWTGYNLTWPALSWLDELMISKNMAIVRKLCNVNAHANIPAVYMAMLCPRLGTCTVHTDCDWTVASLTDQSIASMQVVNECPWRH